MNARVSRSARGSSARNRIRLVRFTIFFQQYPGVGGRSSHRGISGAPYTITADGNQVSSGQTPASGRVRVAVPASTSTININIFDTDYEIWNFTSPTPLNAVSMNNQPGGANVPNLRGVKERLYELGYMSIAGNDVLDAETDDAVLNYQADSALNPDGDVGRNTLRKLRNDTPR